MKPQKTIIMKAIIRFCKELSLRHFTKRQYAVFIIASTLSFTSLSAQTTITWIGAGTLTGSNTTVGQDLNNRLNWDALSVPTASDNVVISLTGGATLNLTGNLSVKNLTLVVLHANVNNPNNNNNPDYLNVGAYTLTVNGNTIIDISDDHPLNRFYVGVTDGSTSAGTIDFVGNVVAGTTDVRDGVVFTGNPNSTIICRSNLTLNIRAQVLIGSEPGTLLFDGTGTQTVTYNNLSTNTQGCRFKNVVIGKTNNPTVVMAGSTSPDNLVGDLTVNGRSVLDLTDRQLNRHLNGGNLFLKNTSTLRLGGLVSSANYGTASLIPGSNFPSGFTNIVLDSTSTVEFYGANQSIPGAANNTVNNTGTTNNITGGYGNLTLTNNTKTPISSFAMFRKLTIAANTTMGLDSSNVTLRSNNVTTAYVAAVPTSAIISYGGTGRFVIERYLSKVKSWRLLATPIQNDTITIRNSWRESGDMASNGYGTQITGPVLGIGMDQTTQRGSMKWYNKATNNYVEITNTNNTIARSQGYYVFIRGDRAQNVAGAGSVTNLRIKGKILTGNQVFTTLTATSPTNGFESVGNPYASKINYKTAIKADLEPSFTVWNPTAGYYGVGRFIQYVSITGVNGDYSNGGTVMNTIESGQAFFIQATKTKSGTLTVQESDKLDGSYLVSRNGNTGRGGVVVPSLEVNLLNLDNAANPTLLDHVAMKFDDNFSTDTDQNDVRKFMNADDNLAIKNGTRNLILNSRKSLTAADTIFLSLSNTRIALYRFKIDPSVLGNLSLKAFLKDKFLQTEIPVSLTDVTNVNFNITVDAASRATDRFMIVFKNVAPAVFTAIKAVRNNDNSVAVTWNMRNENNINTYSIERSTDGGTNYIIINSQMPTANNFGSPYYTVTDADAPKEMVWYRIQANNISNGSFYSDKAAAKAVDVNNKHGISMYPNLVVDGTVNLYFNNQPAGKYNISIVNSKGEQVKFSTAEIHNNAGLKYILIKEAAAGMYRAIIKDEKGISVVIPFVKL